MSRFKIFMSLVILIASIVLLLDKLFTPQPIQIILQSGQEITTSTAEYFSLSEVLLLITGTLLIGITSSYLFYNSDTDSAKNPQPYKSNLHGESYDTLLPLLKLDERLAINSLLENDGEMHQNKLAAKLIISTVKTTRLLHRLEQKNLIIRERHGFTNMVKLKQKFNQAQNSFQS